MLDLVIIADDITGALDSGVQLARKGRRTYVAPLESAANLSLSEIEVLVVDTESRHLRAEEAAARVRTAVAAIDSPGARVFYKKTDSTLRGNIGAEIEAILTESGRDSVAYVPSYPDGGRIASGGILSVNGVPVSQTDFARDPLNPVTTSSIPDLLALQTGLPSLVATVKLPLPLPLGTVVVFDAVENADLARLAVLLRPERERVIFAGCAGFAAYLDRMLEPGRLRPLDPLRRSSGRRLIVCGSLNPRSLAQMERAESMGIPQYDLELCESDPNLPNRVRRDVESRGTVAIRTAAPGESREPDGLRVADRVGHVTARLLEEVGFDALIVFGGDTLMAIMREIGVDGILPLDEVEAGVPVSRSVGARRTPLIVSKAGGFGDEEVLSRIEDYLDLLGENPSEDR